MAVEVPFVNRHRPEDAGDFVSERDDRLVGSPALLNVQHEALEGVQRPAASLGPVSGLQSRSGAVDQ